MSREESSAEEAHATTTTGLLLRAVQDGIRIYDLGRPLTIGMPQSPNHPAFWHALPRRHGDMVRADGGSAANDVITMGTHVGTHIDAFSHVSQDGRLIDGSDAVEASRGGRFAALGAHTIAPMLRRGVLLDVPAALGTPEGCAPGYEITPDDLAATAERQGTPIGAGDVVLIRSGWGRLFGDRDAYTGLESGVPGVGEAGATWLADHEPHAVGADTIAFECLKPGGGHSLLPAHRVLLVERGVYIIETMVLDELAADGVHEFAFVLSPLPIFGATGSPVRPLAVVGRG
ncbi:cyclase family protein [Nonomuraea cavernae]|uniref:Cyclase n=1 Tax=Nonomuraea cavernae TaxID=2045107 RepID=A0A917Z1J9_9ACTN|nr:cyclase family protein [Nonomuraea cavernae]MCA2187936.1 cyclase family protein [Nonomuraea cavernae]GGO72298.1 cyclase [Nonomuraea cavernae]